MPDAGPGAVRLLAYVRDKPEEIKSFVPSLHDKVGKQGGSVAGQAMTMGCAAGYKAPGANPIWQLCTTVCRQFVSDCRTTACPTPPQRGKKGGGGRVA